jgi:hypothetical protein
MESAKDDRNKLLQKIQVICDGRCPKYWFPRPGMDDCPAADCSYQVKDPCGRYFTIRPMFYEALPYKGRSTTVFAWVGLPSPSSENNAKSNSKVPAMVLVHGGGGTEKSVSIYYHCYGGLRIIHFSFFVHQYYV